MPEIANGNTPGDKPRQVVLVVDDEDLVRNFMRRVLVDAGYEVVSASNGQDAMAILESLVVDLVVTDIRMPGMDGRELGVLISQLPLAPPVLFASASDNPPAGMHNYLPKPFTGRQLVQMAQELLAERRASLSSREHTGPPTS